MRILVVDDEVSVCSSVADYLRDQGFDVDEAYDGAGALVIAKEHGETIDAVLTDVNMPGMDGLEMWQHMKALVSPECKILFMSGLAQQYLRDSSSKFPARILQKPFSFSVLLEQLSE